MPTAESTKRREAAERKARKERAIRYPHTVVFRLDPETLSEIVAFAKRRRIPQAEAIRLLVEWGLETAAEDGAT